MSPGLSQGQVAVTAPLPGVVLRYTVEVGQQVKKGEPTVVLEAMKMENSLPSPADGVVKQLCVDSGAKVGRGARLVVIAPG